MWKENSLTHKLGNIFKILNFLLVNVMLVQLFVLNVLLLQVAKSVKLDTICQVKHAFNVVQIANHALELISVQLVLLGILG